MEPNENTNITEQGTPAETPTTKRKYTKHAAPVKKAKKAAPRTIEDLESLPTAKMTDIEKDVYISYLRGMVNQKDAQLKNLDDTARKIFERGATAERAYNDLKTQVDRDMQLIRASVTLFSESITNHTFGGN